jgi:hypothetical protein
MLLQINFVNAASFLLRPHKLCVISRDFLLLPLDVRKESRKPSRPDFIFRRSRIWLSALKLGVDGDF